MKSPQRGMALIEALVASAVLGIGLLGATQLTLRALQLAAETRQRHVAQILAQEAMDCALSGMTCASTDSIDLQGVRYTRQLRTTPRSASLQDIHVSVQWASAQSSSAANTRLDVYSSQSTVPRWVGP